MYKDCTLRGCDVVGKVRINLWQSVIVRSGVKDCSKIPTGFQSFDLLFDLLFCLFFDVDAFNRDAWFSDPC